MKQNNAKSYTEMPASDIWHLEETQKNSLHYKKSFSLNFRFITRQKMKSVIQSYFWRHYREKTKALNSLRNEIMMLRHFINFCDQHRINDLLRLKADDIDLFLSYLKTAALTKQGKPLARASQRLALIVIKNVIRWAQIYIPDSVPKEDIFTNNEFPGINKRHHIEILSDLSKNLINKALLNDDSDFYVKCGLIICRDTGMRIGDVLNLKIDCISTDKITGDKKIQWYDHKSQKTVMPRAITQEGQYAVDELINETKFIRKDASSSLQKHLFIRRDASNEVSLLSYHMFRISMIKFLKDNKLGKYNITPQIFRKTLASDMISDDRDLEIIRQILGHGSSNTTLNYYTNYNDKKYSKVFKGFVVGDIDKLNGIPIKRKDWFQNHKNKARMIDGYCTEPIKDDTLCKRIRSRNSCYFCDRYITTPEYIEPIKGYLNDLEDKLLNNPYGPHYAEHIEPVVNVLREIVDKLESLIHVI